MAIRCGQEPEASANYPESKFLDPFLSEIHEPERIKELAQLKERKVAALLMLWKLLWLVWMLPSLQRQQRRYQHSLEMSRYQTNLQRQQYQLASLVNQLQEVESKLEEIVAVRPAEAVPRLTPLLTQRGSALFGAGA